jgi:hypothetical protein
VKNLYLQGKERFFAPLRMTEKALYERLCPPAPSRQERESSREPIFCNVFLGQDNSLFPQDATFINNIFLLPPLPQGYDKYQAHGQVLGQGEAAQEPHPGFPAIGLLFDELLVDHGHENHQDEP